MNSGMYQLNLRKESFKFSSAHMTVFPDGSPYGPKESLHGHNFQVEVNLDLNDASLERFVSFSYFKKLIEKICREWHSKVLLARQCPKMQTLQENSNEIEILLCGKRYVFPAEDVLFLDVENITSELLSYAFFKTFHSRLDPNLLSQSICGISVRIEEVPGQGATFFWKP